MDEAVIFLLLAVLAIVAALALAGVLAFAIAIVATEPEDQAHQVSVLDTEGLWWLP